MLRTLVVMGSRGRAAEFCAGSPVWLIVNPDEMKQVQL